MIIRELIVRKVCCIVYIFEWEQIYRVSVHVTGITKRSVEFSLFQIRGTLVLVMGIMGIEIQTCICLGTMSGTLRYRREVTEV